MCETCPHHNGTDDTGFVVVPVTPDSTHQLDPHKSPVRRPPQRARAGRGGGGTVTWERECQPGCGRETDAIGETGKKKESRHER
jgi:hypothetical protein